MKIRIGGVFISFLLVAGVSLSSALGQENTNSATKQKRGNESEYAEITEAPEKARSKRNPLEKDPDAIAAGRILFEQRCAECHGNNADGKKGPSLRAPEIQNAEPGAIFWVLTNGVVRKGMPVWSKLPEPQRWQLVSFIKSLGTVPAKTQPSCAECSQSPSAMDSSMPRR